MLCSRKHRDCQTTCLGCSQVAVRSEVGPAWRSKCAGRQHMQNECSGPVMVQHGSAGTTTRHVSQQAGSHAVRTSGSHACAYRTVWLAAMLCKQDGLASTSSPQEACKLGPGSQGLSRHQIASAASRPPPACLPASWLCKIPSGSTAARCHARPGLSPARLGDTPQPQPLPPGGHSSRPPRLASPFGTCSWWSSSHEQLLTGHRAHCSYSSL